MNNNFVYNEETDTYDNEWLSIKWSYGKWKLFSNFPSIPLVVGYYDILSDAFDMGVDILNEYHRLELKNE